CRSAFASGNFRKSHFNIPFLSPGDSCMSGSDKAGPDSSEISRAAASRAAWALYIIVLVSGAVLMGVEIGGAKVLAPGFGTSTFVWGSIIGMFMAAMATGYFMGGLLADKKPSFSVLAG